MGDCIHYVNVTAIDDLGNTMCDNEIFYVDNTPPVQEYEFGDPKNTINTAFPVVGIGPNTPVWINSSDIGECAVGTKSLTYFIMYPEGHDPLLSGYC